jgi:hypothetical protein
MRLEYGEHSAVLHEYGLVNGLTSDLPLFSERHSSAVCAELYLPLPVASSPYPRLYPEWTRGECAVANTTRSDAGRRSNRYLFFARVSPVSVSQKIGCPRVSASSAVSIALYSDRLVQFGRFIAYRSTPHLMFYRSRINGDKQVKDLRRRLPLPLSHSTELECTLFRTPSPIPRRYLAGASIQHVRCWQGMFSLTRTTFAPFR